MVAMNVAAFQPLDVFHTKIDEYIRSLKDVPLADGHHQVYYPGEMEKNSDLKNRELGLELPRDTLEDMLRVAQEAGLGRQSIDELRFESRTSAD
jgi:LDH2 family malate/lactate/ureidoglycolate dehydrogenase